MRNILRTTHRARRVWAMIMESLFVYGTLRDQEVQRLVFGRAAASRQDALPGFTRSRIALDRAYPLIRPSTGRSVRGLVVQVSRRELAAIDAYETDAYRRIAVVLRSGARAWAYAARDGIPRRSSSNRCVMRNHR